MEKTFTTKSVEERNAFIEKCYNENIKYTYYRVNSSGDYIVKYNDKSDE